MGADDKVQKVAPTLTWPQAVNRQKEIKSEMDRVAALDDPTAEDERYFEELNEEFRNVDNFRKKLEREHKLKAITSVAENITANTMKMERGSQYEYDKDPVSDPDSVEEGRFRNPWDLSEVRTFDRDQGSLSAEYRSRALSAIEKMPAANDKIRSAATDLIERWDTEDGKLSKLVLALSEPTYMRAWAKLAKAPLAPDLDDAERKSVARVNQFARAMSLTDAAGGYLVPFQLDPTVIITANGSYNQIRQVARQVVATADVWNGVSAGSVSWSWDAEAAEVSDDTPTFAQPTIPNYKAQGFVPISIEALADAENVSVEVGRLLAFGKDELEAAAFVLGTGSGQPTGIVTALTATASEINAAADDTFALADIFTIQGALPARYRSRASWLANNSIYNRIRQFDTAGGAGMWERIGADRPPLLLGRPALEAEGMDGSVTTTGAVSNFILVFGDFDNYVITDRIGMTVEFIPHLFGANQRPTNSRGWIAYVRHGADSVNDAAFRMLNVT
jgi:HK97 family phage major capsid protein